MAQLVVIDPPRDDAERNAQKLLANMLPVSWIVTTNIYEAHFPKRKGRTKSEVDGVLICPVGVVVLSLKHYSGLIVPKTSGQWGGVIEKDNPINKVTNQMYQIKHLTKNELGDKFKLERLIVLTNRRVELDWTSTQLPQDEKLRITRVPDVEATVRAITEGGKTLLDGEKARQILVALETPEIGDDLFNHQDWKRDFTVSRDAERTVQSLDVSQVSHSRTPTVQPSPLTEEELAIRRTTDEAKQRLTNLLGEAALLAFTPLNRAPAGDGHRYIDRSYYSEDLITYVDILNYRHDRKKLLRQIELLSRPGVLTALTTLYERIRQAHLALITLRNAVHRTKGLTREEYYVSFDARTHSLLNLFQRASGVDLGALHVALADLDWRFTKAAESLFQSAKAEAEAQDAKMLLFRNYSLADRLCEYAAALGHSKASEVKQKGPRACASNYREDENDLEIARVNTGESGYGEPGSYSRRGTAYRAKKLYDRAIVDFTMVVELEPTYGKCYLMRGLCFLDKGENEKALRDFNQALRMEPKNVFTLRQRAEAHLAKGDYASAVTDLNEAIRLNPGEVDAYLQRGYAFHRSGKYQLAIADFDQAISFDQKRAYAYGQRGRSYNNLGRYDQAIVDLTDAIGKGLKRAWIYNERGFAYERTNNKGRAIADFRLALKLDEADEYAREAIEQLSGSR